MNWKKAIIYLLPIVILIYLYATRPSPEIHQAIFRINRTLSKSAGLASRMSRDQKRNIADRFRGNQEALKPIIYGAMDQMRMHTDAFEEVYFSSWFDLKLKKDL